MFRKVLGILMVFVVGGFSLASFPEICFAAPTPDKPAEVVNVEASAGTLVAAVLETAGYKAQAGVLSALRPMLIGLGLLVFIGSALYGLTLIAIMGEYKEGLWFFIGPPLFFFMITPNTEAAGANWQFGSFVDQQNQVETILQKQAYAEQQVSANVKSKVSFLFHQYNKLVSSVVQSLVSLITDPSHQKDSKTFFKFTVRQRIMDGLMQTEVVDPGLKSLMIYNMTQCSQEMEDARMIALGERDVDYQLTSEYRIAKARFDKASLEKNVKFTESIEKDYLRDLVMARSLAYKDLANSKATIDTNMYMKCIKDDLDPVDNNSATQINKAVTTMLNQPISCNKLWCLMGLGIHNEVMKSLANIKENVAPGIDAKFYREILNDIAKKLQKGEKWVNAEGEAIKTAVDPDLSVIPVIIGGYILRKSMTDDLHSDAMTRIADRSGYYIKSDNFSMEGNTGQVYSQSLKFQEEIIATAKRHDIYTVALGLPYMQGILLYALALMFPFFAILLLVPGQAKGFFIWLSMWAWVKSWDIGWAVTMVIDNLLWDMLPHSSLYDPLKDPNHGPVSVFQSAFTADSAYSLGNYYIILGMLLTAVPFVTGQMLLGGKTVFAGFLLDGLRDLGSIVGGDMDRSRSNHSTGQTDYMREAYRVYQATHAEPDGRYSKASQEYQAMGDQLIEQGENLQDRGISWLKGGMGLGAVASLISPGLGTLIGGAGLELGMNEFLKGKDLERGGNLRKGEGLQRERGMKLADLMENSRVLKNIEAMRTAHSTRPENNPFKGMGVPNQAVEEYIKAQVRYDILGTMREVQVKEMKSVVDGILAIKHMK